VSGLRVKVGLLLVSSLIETEPVLTQSIAEMSASLPRKSAAEAAES
jgi:hypothetical protein